MTRSLIERADVARESLFKRYDDLNALWNEAEQQLGKLHIPKGVEHCYYTYSDPREERDWESSYLGVQKVKGKWRICHATSCSAWPFVEDWTPITDCSAETRVEAAEHLPGLIKATVETAEDFIPEVDKAIKALRKGLEKCSDNSLKELLAERAKLNGKAK